jgi:hypothetical protein
MTDLEALVGVDVACRSAPSAVLRWWFQPSATPVALTPPHNCP